MFLASKTAWAGMAFTILTTGMLAQGFRKAAQDPTPTKKELQPHQNEIKKMQETLRNKRHYRARSMASSVSEPGRAFADFRKVENLPVTGQLDTQTGAKLGVRPEGSQQTGNETPKGKPSAGIKWSKGLGRTNKTLGKAVKTVTAPETGWGDRAKTFQAENDNHP